MARVTRFSTPAALLAVAAASALALAGGASARQSVLPTLYVDYTMNCTFSISDDSRKKVTQILPGTYQVLVTTPMVFADVDLSGIFDMTACKSYVQFKLTGPGVSIDTTLQDGDEDKEMISATFQPSATYTAQDMNQAAVTRTQFTTSATGAPAQPVGSSTSSAAASGKGSTQKELVGSAVVASFRGSLDATVFKSGKLTLSRNGKAVTSLKTGRWTFAVDDESSKAGFTVQSLTGKPQKITTSTYVGSHNATVDLKAGRWFYFTTGGKKTTFFVVS